MFCIFYLLHSCDGASVGQCSAGSIDHWSCPVHSEHSSYPYPTGSTDHLSGCPHPAGSPDHLSCAVFKSLLTERWLPHQILGNIGCPFQRAAAAAALVG